MKKINVIVHYPKDELAAEYIMEATSQTYLRSVKKVCDKSSLTINEKQDLLIKKIDTYIK